MAEEGFFKVSKNLIKFQCPVCKINKMEIRIV